MLYILFYHKHLGLGNVSLAFVKQDYFGEQSYKSCLKKRKSAVRDTSGDRKKKANNKTILQCENFLATQQLTQNRS